MKTLEPGLYEQLVNEDISKSITNLSPDLKKTEKIDGGTSSIVLSQYVESIVRAALEKAENKDKQVELTNDIIRLLNQKTESEFSGHLITKEKETLLEIKANADSITKDKLRPATSLTHSYLFTGDIDMKLVSELKREIATSDRIDMLVSFLKVSGIAMIRDQLKEFTNRGGKLRVIATTYMGATDLKAVTELCQLPGTEIRISYDTKHTRLHAKSYMFYRNTGFDTAYVGSSNLSGAAITDGREWNVKITSHDQSDVFRQMQRTFEIYWSSEAFTPFTLNDVDKLQESLLREKAQPKNTNAFFSFDVQPYPFQQAILDRLEAERELHENNRNLVVAATGTGKTVISAFDYKRFREQNRGAICRLLFIAHREEILQQSLACFRSILKDPDFGDILTGNFRPSQRNHLFASIQSANSQHFTQLFAKDYFDFIIVDEFHHAAADSYQDLLRYFTPKILLGLTATPERMDGQDILQYFDGHHIAAEIRLGEAIEKQLLCPFHYYGINDGTDLSTLRWSRGGYEKSELDNVYVLQEKAAEKRARLIINSLTRYVSDPSEIRCIGFCVSRKHAEFMSCFFNENGLKSMNIDSNTPLEIRRSAKLKLESKAINFLFVVDLYNEGVDIPSVDTVMFLRPTESSTVFLQQLGRGLRIEKGKEFLTVLDFIGQANRKYRFAEKFSAITTVPPRDIQREIKEEFVNVPKGCYIELDKVSQEIILRNLRLAMSTKATIIERLKELNKELGRVPTLKEFLTASNMDTRALYKVDSYHKLCESSGLFPTVYEELDKVMINGFKRLVHIDSKLFIKTILRFLNQTTPYDDSKASQLEKSIVDMFRFSIHDDAEKDGISRTLLMKELSECPHIKQEIIDLLTYNLEKIDFISYQEGNNPLECYCTYTRDQILSGLGEMRPTTMREGIKFIKDKATDVFLITLNKSDKEFSPSTMYNDYAITPSLFHWESQSTTSVNSPTGQRYINHKETGNKIYLFVREKKNDSFGAMPYTFIGEAEYVSHEGSAPIQFVWKLKHPIPARFIGEMSRGIAL